MNREKEEKEDAREKCCPCKKKKRIIRDKIVKVRKKEENREKYRDSKNIAGDIQRKGAPRTLGMEKKKEEKRCGTRISSIVRRRAARGARSRVRTGPCTIQIYVYAVRCTCINRTHA